MTAISPYKKYTIHSLVAQGGSGQLYLALDERVAPDRLGNKRIALLKTTMEDIKGSSKQKALLSREFNISTKVSHPGLVKIYGLEAIDESMYEDFITQGKRHSIPAYVLELEPIIFSDGTHSHLSSAIRGQQHIPTLAPSLSSYLNQFVPKDAFLPPSAFARLGRELAHIVMTLQSYNIVHGDLKPDNILIQSEHPFPEKVRFWCSIIDLGSACPLNPNLPGATSGPELVGTTPEYLPIEHLLEGGYRFTDKTDVGALGYTLYWMLEGRTPYDSPEAQVLRQHASHPKMDEYLLVDLRKKMLATRAKLFETPKKLDNQQSNYPQIICELIWRMCLPKPEERPSIEEVYQTFLKWEEGLENGTWPASHVYAPNPSEHQKTFGETTQSADFTPSSSIPKEKEAPYLPNGPFTSKTETNSRTKRKVRETCALIGPIASGKGCLLSSFNVTCALMKKGEHVLRVATQDQKADIFFSEFAIEHLLKTNIPPRWGGEITAGGSRELRFFIEYQAHSRLSRLPFLRRSTKPEFFQMIAIDAPSPVNFKRSFLTNEKSISEEAYLLADEWGDILAEQTKNASTLLLCVDPMNPRADVLFRNLRAYFAKTANRREDGMSFSPIKRFLLLLTKVDKLASFLAQSDSIQLSPLELASKLDPIFYVKELLGESILGMIQGNLHPSADLSVGFCSAFGFDKETGEPLEKVADKMRREWRGPKEQLHEMILRKWQPFGVEAVLMFIVKGQRGETIHKLDSTDIFP